MGVRDKLWEAVPFTVMVTMEASTIALTIMAKTVMSNGISPFVFVAYTNSLASLFLLPYFFIFHRDRTQPLFTLPLLMQSFFLGLTGITIAQNFAFVGLSYSSPIVVCAMGLLIPPIAFILSIVLRTSKVDWRCSSFQSRVMGSLISVMGGIVVSVYKGPLIRKSSSSHQLQQTPPLFVFYSTPENWLLGSIFLAAASFSVSVWNIIQMETVKQCPQVMKVVSFYSLFGTIQCVTVSLAVERELSAWRLKLNLELLIIVLTAIFGAMIRSHVHIWCMSLKGPFYVPIFKPFGIIFATIFGVSFFANSLHYGSVIGAIIVGIGYYAVMWGQIRENEISKDNDVESVASYDKKVPLLQENTDQV